MADSPAGPPWRPSEVYLPHGGWRGSPSGPAINAGWRPTAQLSGPPPFFPANFWPSDQQIYPGSTSPARPLAPHLVSSFPRHLYPSGNSLAIPGGFGEAPVPIHYQTQMQMQSESAPNGYNSIQQSHFPLQSSQQVPMPSPPLPPPSLHPSHAPPLAAIPGTAHSRQASAPAPFASYSPHFKQTSVESRIIRPPFAISLVAPSEGREMEGGKVARPSLDAFLQELGTRVTSDGGASKPDFKNNILQLQRMTNSKLDEQGMNQVEKVLEQGKKFPNENRVVEDEGAMASALGEDIFSVPWKLQEYFIRVGHQLALLEDVIAELQCYSVGEAEDHLEGRPGLTGCNEEDGGRSGGEDDCQKLEEATTSTVKHSLVHVRNAVNEIQTACTDTRPKDMDRNQSLPVANGWRAMVSSEGLRAKEKQPRERKTRAMQAALKLEKQLRALLAPLERAIDAGGGSPTLEALELSLLVKQRDKVLRNRKWRKKKRQRTAEAVRKEREKFEELDRAADEWRAQELAKSIAQRKMEELRELAEAAAEDERRNTEKELEMVLMLEHLQELRDLRISKLRRQGHLLPEEDDKFLERVKAAVEEEERLIATSKTAAAIASAEEAAKQGSYPEQGHAQSMDSAAQKKTQSSGNLADDDSNSQLDGDAGEDIAKGDVLRHGHASIVKSSEGLGERRMEGEKRSDHERGAAKEPSRSGVEEMPHLSADAYDYYYGSQRSMSRLVEVRRHWDAFIMQGGSRIPGHWVEPSPPSDPVWASVLAQT